MKKFSDILKETYSNSSIMEEESFIIEGLVINGKKVSLTDSHTHGVNFNLVSNPICYNYEGMQIISIFKRTKLKDENNFERDGNPFIYALKGKNGWTFDITPEDTVRYIRRFLLVCDKIKGKYDTIIEVPSSSQINTRFMKTISRQVQSSKTISNYFIKREKSDVYDNYINWDIIFKHYGEKFPEVKAEIDDGFRKMESENFEAKLIKKEYLKYISYIATNNEEVSQFINNKDILILDDILSSGNTVSQCVQNINKNFVPKSITVITLLSNVQK